MNNNRKFISFPTITLCIKYNDDEDDDLRRRGNLVARCVANNRRLTAYTLSPLPYMRRRSARSSTSNHCLYCLFNSIFGFLEHKHLLDTANATKIDGIRFEIDFPQNGSHGFTILHIEDNAHLWPNEIVHELAATQKGSLN